MKDLLITDEKELRNFYSDRRVWQGIPGIEKTVGGRLFATFYSGATTETCGNFCCVIRSDDDGNTWSEPVAVAYDGEDFRCFDPVLWIDPQSRLWFTWARAPQNGLWASVCDDPDAEELVWSKPREIAHNVMMNKPTVISTGEWLFPVADWKVRFWDSGSPESERRSYVYRSSDNGKSFVRLGGADVPERSFDEHMVVEEDDGSLHMYVRTFYGIGESFSYDGGATWTSGRDSGIKGPCSRFHIRRLPNGNILLINHVDFKARDHLTAQISTDGGKTFSKGLLIDSRDQISYPDCTVDREGRIYVIYDRDRGSEATSLKEVKGHERAIYLAKITEADIFAGELVDSESRLCMTVNRLCDCNYSGSDLYKEERERALPRLVSKLAAFESGDDIVSEIFKVCGSSRCAKMDYEASGLIDKTVSELLLHAADLEPDEKSEKIKLLVGLLTANYGDEDECESAHGLALRIIDAIHKAPSENWTIDKIASDFYLSRYYLCHFFKKETGISVIRYVLSCRISAAKQLLKSTSLSVSVISDKCGFGSAAYFARVFREETGMTPKDYRKYLNSCREGTDVKE